MKKFNIATSCVPSMHYMVDISGKIKKIRKLIDVGEYFTINKARQFGKTTARYALKSELKDEYIVLNISFEGQGEKSFQDEESFSKSIFTMFADSVSFNDENLEKEFIELSKDVSNFKELSRKVTKFVKKNNKKIILLIDEVDKSSNNQLFLSFLGLLRDKYIGRNNGEDATFWSVVLFGVHDIKNLKVKVRPGEIEMLNSPWNVAVDFKVDMTFNPKEISTMLIDFEKDYKTGMDIEKISNLIYYYTSGYPYLVSKLPFLIHEELDDDFTEEGMKKAVKSLLKEKNTLFDDLIKNFENNKDLYRVIKSILLEGNKIGYNISNPILGMAEMYGIIKANNESVKIHNIIFEKYIYDYMISKRETSKGRETASVTRSEYIKENGDLDMTKVLDRFQDFMYREYRKEDEKFLEKNGRLIFLAWIKPIINGIGFYDVESETRDNKKMD
ncbi:MAG: AAA family ATPase, partial [Bacillota bacterium]|nr:AAA family ATPase [Bacillota bacterium]